MFINGFKKHPLYGTYRQMISRCYNERAAKFKFYGGRGIAVCDEWKDADAGLRNFLSWADSIEPKDKAALQLDREDNDKWYSPENCRFVSRSFQNRNTRSNTWVTFQKKKILFIECFEQFGNPDIAYNTAWTRFYSGWSVEDAISKPYQRRRSNHQGCKLEDAN